MSAAGASSLRTLAFGDLDAAVWGAAWVPDPSRPGFVGLGTGAQSVTVAAGLAQDGDAGDWRLDGDGLQLTASAAADGAAPPAGAEFDQLCRVQGRITVDGTDRAIDCLGRRALHAQAVDLDRFESIRDVSAWFDSSHGLSLVALRPRKSRGQESDLVSAVALDPEGSLAVIDPRLSTTYAADGRPLRVGLELWLEGDGDEEQFPRRATGETLGSAATGRIGRFDLHAQFVRWSSHDGDGAGVYLLAQQA
jgi:hypothetical protein